MVSNLSFSPNNESSCSQYNLTVTLCCGECASTRNDDELIIREFRGEREKSVLYNITVSGGDFSSPPNVQSTQPITEKGEGGGVSIRQTELRNVPFLLVLHLRFCMSFQLHKTN